MNCNPLALAVVLATQIPALATDHYIDADSGSDANPGTSPAQAWQSPAAASDHPFQPGDRILLRRGQVHTGSLQLTSIEGTEINPVVISDFGDSPARAILDGSGLANSVNLLACRHVHVENLEITGSGVNAEAYWPQAPATQFGPHHFRNLIIHDTSGTGINLAVSNLGGYTFRDIVIENCLLEDIGNVGIAINKWAGTGVHAVQTIGVGHPLRTPGTYTGVTTTNRSVANQNTIQPAEFTVIVDASGAATIEITHQGSGYMVGHQLEIPDSALGGGGAPALTFEVAAVEPSDANEHYHTDLVIRNNTIRQTQAAGIQVGKIANGLIEGNMVTDPGRDLSQAGSGLWTWFCGTPTTSFIIQRNTFTGSQGETDACGVHIDIGCVNTIVQYNLSRDNQGGFAEILGDSSNCVYRYNISINDGARVLGENGALQHGSIFFLDGYTGRNGPQSGPDFSYIYNNTIYVDPSIMPNVSIADSTRNAHIFNNVVVFGQAGVDNSPITQPTGVAFHNNLVFENRVPAAAFSTFTDNRVADPAFANPGGPLAEDYLPQNRADIIDLGIAPAPLPGDPLGVLGGLEVSEDFFGHPITGMPDLGAVELPTIAPPVITRGPYLQGSGPDRMTIRWTTDRGADSVVRHGATTGGLDHETVVAGSRTAHEVTLTGLTPGARYFYQVESRAADGGSVASTVDEATYFDTAPGHGSTQKTTVWVVGASGTTSVRADRVYQGFQSRLGTTSPHADVWLMLGDIANSLGTDEEYQAPLFDTYPEMLRNTPVWPTLGNYDAGSSGGAAYFDIFTLPTGGECGGVPSGTEHYYSFDHGNIHFISLDSQTAGNYDDVPGTGGMIDWLEADLQATDQDWIIAFLHHAPYTHGSHDSDTDPRHAATRHHLVPLLEAYGVDLILSGQSTQYERSRFIAGHHGPASTSDTFNADNIAAAGSGSLKGAVDVGGTWVADPQLGGGAYRKPLATPDDGSVYAVVGSSGKLGSWEGGSTALVNPTPHPAHLVSLRLPGSMVIEVDAFSLNAKFIDEDGNVRDDFTITKGSAFQLSAGASELAEGGLPLTVTVERTPASDFPDEVGLTVDHDDLATQLPAGLELASGVASATFDLSLPTDALAEGAQTATLRLATTRALQSGAALRRAMLPGSTTSLALTLRDAPSQQWYFEKSGPAELSPTVWQSDVDGDGLPLVMEALFGGSPDGNDTALRPRPVVAGSMLELHYQRDPVLTDITVTGQRSATLAADSWTPTGVLHERIGPTNPDGMEPWKLAIPIDPIDRPSQFLRLMIAPPDKP